MRMLLATFLVMAVVPAAAPADDKPADAAAVRNMIAAQNAKYSEAVTKQDLQAFMALFTDEATVMLVGRTYKGKSEWETAAKEQLATLKNPMLKTTELGIRGDLAYEVGEYTVTLRENGRTTSGTYLVVWKRQKGGEWLIYVEATLPGASKR